MPTAITFNTGSTEYKEMLPYWREINDIYKGAFSITKEGNIKNYLVKFHSESDTSYETRTVNARFENFFSPTIRQIANLPFSEKIEIPEKFKKDEFVNNFVTNVDGIGTNIEAFFKNVLNKSLGFGFCGVLVDSPELSDGETRETGSDKYPNFSFFSPLDIKGIWGSFVNGKFVIERLWLHIIGTEYENKAESIDSYYYEYILNNNSVEVIKYNFEEKIIKQSKINIDRIPFHLFYLTDNKSGIMEVVPHFYDLIKMNLSHFNKMSDNDHIIRTTSFPMLTATGLSTQQEIDNLTQIGPQKILASANQNAKFAWLDHSGRSIESGRQSLKDLELKMRAYEIQFLLRQSSNITATQVTNEESRSTSYIKLIAQELDDFIGACMHDALYFRGVSFEEEDLRFQTFKKFSILSLVKDKIKIILDTYKAQGLSKTTLINELKRYEIINRDIDTEAEIGQIEKELAESLRSALPDEADDPEGDDENPDNQENNQNDPNSQDDNQNNNENNNQNDDQDPSDREGAA